MSQIRSIQVLRALAALSVAFGHLQSEAFTMPAASHGYSPILLDLTGAGVDLFFVISGFIMVYASHDLFSTTNGGLRFLKRRVARIVPLYWLMTTLFLLTLVVLPQTLSSPTPNVVETLASYFFIPYARAGSIIIEPVYKLGWTLEYEMFFYFVFSALLFLPMRLALTGITGLFCCLVAVGATLAHPPGLFAFWSNPIILEFVMGILIAATFLSGRRLPVGGSLTLFALGLLGFALTTYLGLDAHGPWRPLLWGVPAAVMVAAAVFSGQSSASSGRLLAFFVALGDASYALYLVHPMVIRLLRLIWNHVGWSADISPWIFIASAIIILMPMSIIVHIWIEQPMTNWVRRLLSRRSSVAAPADAYNVS